MGCPLLAALQGSNSASQNTLSLSISVSVSMLVSVSQSSTYPTDRNKKIPNHSYFHGNTWNIIDFYSTVFILLHITSQKHVHIKKKNLGITSQCLCLHLSYFEKFPFYIWHCLCICERWQKYCPLVFGRM